MKIADIFKARQSREFLPRKLDRFFHFSTQFEGPFRERNVGLDTEVENREATRQMLSGRESLA